MSTEGEALTAGNGGQGRSWPRKRAEMRAFGTFLANQPLLPCVFTDSNKGVDSRTMRWHEAATPAS